jgi:hypothetical protein
MALMDGLVASTLRHSQRPVCYQEFFEDSERGAQDWLLAPVMHGLLLLEKSGRTMSIRPDAMGRMATSRVATPTFTLARLQTAASLRATSNATDNPAAVFWRELRRNSGYFCHAVSH